MKKILIVGGGIIGLFSAYYLQKAGHRVTIFEKGAFRKGCSLGNAGMIVPSHFIPLAAPGMIKKGMRWMLNPESPFYLKPRLNRDLMDWGIKFWRACTDDHVLKSAPALRDISLISRQLYSELSKQGELEFAFEDRGLTMLYKTEKAAKGEAEVAEMANELGIETKILSASEVQDMEPEVKLDVLGGVFYPGDAHLSPELLMNALVEVLEKGGTKLFPNTSVKNILTQGQKITGIETNQGTFEGDEILIAGGAWTAEIVRPLNIRVPMQAGKGYSVTLENSAQQLRIPSILTEAKVAITPMGNRLRFAGTMEITGTDESINLRRVSGMLKSISAYMPDFQLSVPEKKHIWQGLRPCSPDGLPYIGRIPQYEGLSIAGGHAMMGISLAPGTGKLIAELLSEKNPSLSLHPFRINRW